MLDRVLTTLGSDSEGTRPELPVRGGGAGGRVEGTLDEGTGEGRPLLVRERSEGTATGLGEGTGVLGNEREGIGEGGTECRVDTGDGRCEGMGSDGTGVGGNHMSSSSTLMTEGLRVGASESIISSSSCG